MKKIVLLLVLILCNGCSLSQTPKQPANQSSNPIRSDWQTYTNSTYNYSFKYPSTWHIDEKLFNAYQKSHNNIQLDDVVFLTPLTETEINEELKHLDEPSIADGWINVAPGKMIMIQASSIDTNQLHSDEFVSWQPQESIISNSDEIITRFRQTGSYENTIDAEYGFLSYHIDKTIDHLPVQSISFFIQRQLDTTNLITFEQILKTVASTETDPTKTNVNNWQTYTNSTYGYSIHYPSDTYLVSEELNPYSDDRFMTVKLTSLAKQQQYEAVNGYERSDYNIKVSVYNTATDLPGNTAGLDLYDWLKEQGDAITEFHQITFAGVTAYTGLYGSMDAADPVIYAEHNGKIYCVQNERTDNTGPQNDLDDQIIQSFQFIN